jgi:ATPase subunit of ABC transporter with duplicated ATPase domains
VLSARGLDVLDDGLTKAKKAMAEDPTADAIERFSDFEEQFRENGGYEVEGVIARLADGLGLRQDLLLEDIAELSGGQRRRLDLVRVLFQQPEVMVLDEPTNHLDLGAKKWLMDELERFTGALLVISHDIKLLDRAITKVLHLADASLREFKGTYTSYRTQLAADQAQRERSSTLEGREIARLTTLADSMRGSTVRRARIARSLDSRVGRLESTRTVVDKRERKTRFTLPEPQRSAATPLTVEGLSVAYGGPPVLRNVSFSLGRGDVELGVNVALGYFAQEHEQVDPTRTTLDNIDDTILKSITERRALLGSFGLSGKLVDQMPATLSGGERAKLGLAMLAAGQANVLVLDEPTNNLDPASTVAVGEMLSRWPGTIVAVSHDRSFVETLQPTHCLHLPTERFTHWKEGYLDDVALR